MTTTHLHGRRQLNYSKSPSPLLQVFGAPLSSSLRGQGPSLLSTAVDHSTGAGTVHVSCGTAKDVQEEADAGGSEGVGEGRRVWVGGEKGVRKWREGWRAWGEGRRVEGGEEGGGRGGGRG